MARSSHVRIAGVWRDIENIWTRKNGVWREIETAHAKTGGTWQQWWPPEAGPTPPPSGGTYVLSPYTSSWPTGSATGYAQFYTSGYAGRITAVKARISWSTLGSPDSNVYGRASGTYYRAISQDSGWANRTIDHDLGSTAVSQFNAQSANGYSITSLEQFPGPIGLYVNAARLVLVTS